MKMADELTKLSLPIFIEMKQSIKDLTRSLVTKAIAQETQAYARLLDFLSVKIQLCKFA
jgi:hypothetical protein